MAASNGKVVVIVGETASGKSKLAMQLAKQFNGEIVCADSWTVYRGFNIGTAKPTARECRQVRHHLLDIADPREGFSAALFKRHATQAIDDIAARGKLPILVGGSGLYIDSVIFDYNFLPAGPTGQREALNKLSTRELLKKVEQSGLDTSGIDVRNKRRLIRLLESGGQRPLRGGLRPHTLVLGLHVPPDKLEERITKRVDDMLVGGLEQEVRELAELYGWDVEPMKGIGYKEFQSYFEGKQTLEQTRERIKRSTTQLAKKQRTWFKRNNSIQWLEDPGQAHTIVQNFLSK